MKRIKTLLSATALLCCLVATSQATVLVPGGSVVPGVQAGFSGVPVSAPLVSPYIQDSPVGPPVEIVGTVLSQVFVGDVNNTYGVGALSFYYQVVSGASSEILLRFTARGFAGFATDVYTIATGGSVPTDADRSAGAGTTVGFNFLGIGPGGASDILVIHTDAKFFALNNGTVSDGVVANMPVFAPTPVPEPGTMVAGALLLLPFALSTVRRLRKNRTA